MKIMMMAAAIRRAVNGSTDGEVKYDDVIYQPYYDESVGWMDDRSILTEIYRSKLSAPTEGPDGIPALNALTNLNGLPYITTPNALNSDFTVEAWISPLEQTTANQYIASIADNSLTIRWRNGSLVVMTGNTVLVTATLSPVIGNWYHVAACRNNGVISFYVNGFLQGTVVNTTIIQLRTVAFGNHSTTGGNATAWCGLIAGMRISTRAVYTEEFVPSTKYTRPHQYNELTFDPMLSSVNFISGRAFAINEITGSVMTSIGSPKTILNEKRQGHAIYEFDGASGYVIDEDGSSFNFGMKDFTVECQVNVAPENTGADRIIIGRLSESGGMMGWQIGLTNNRIDVKLSTNGTSSTHRVFPDAVLTANRWYTIGISRVGKWLRVFLNGIHVGEISVGVVSLFEATTKVSIGNGMAGTSGLIGKVSAIRITKGIGRYIDHRYLVRELTHYPLSQTGPVPAGIDPYSQFTSMFIPFENSFDAIEQWPYSVQPTGTIIENGGPFSKGAARLVTGNRGPARTYGRSILGTGDFTVECWFRTDWVSASNPLVMVGQWINSNSGVWQLTTQGNDVRFYYNQQEYLSCGVIANDQEWHHVAVVRRNGIIKIYFDGKEKVSAEIGEEFTTNHPVYNLETGTTTYASGKYMELAYVRVIRDIAKYYADFEPDEGTTGPLSASIV